MNRDYWPKIEQPRPLPDGGGLGFIEWLIIGSFLGSTVCGACFYFNLIDLI